jgi:hypothetical protein
MKTLPDRLRDGWGETALGKRGWKLGLAWTERPVSWAFFVCYAFFVVIPVPAASRRAGKRLAACLTLAFLAIHAASAQPANDNFANAFVISGTSVRATGTNVDATREPGEPTSVQDGAGREPTGNRSVWWRWVAPASGQVTVATGRLTPASERSTFDTQLGVYTGNAVNALTEVASNEDAVHPTTGQGNYLGGGLSELRFNAVAGTTYHIMVNGWQSQTGNIVLHLGDSGAPPAGHTITVSANPAAGGTVTGGGTFQTGESATVTAAPNAGFQFLNWTEGGTAVSTNLSFTFNVAANRTLVANFAGDTTGTNITVNVSSSPAAGGTVTGGGTFAPGTQVTVTATPNQSFTFVEWREGTTVVGTDAQLTFQANAHRNLVAVFSGSPQRYTLLITVTPSEAGFVTVDPEPDPGGKYDPGTIVTLTATANSGYRFQSWWVKGFYSQQGNTATLPMEGDRSVTAYFEKFAPDFFVSTIQLTARSEGQWNQRSPLPTGNSLMGVAWNGVHYVAVGDLGTVLTSPDGINWTPRSSGTDAGLSGIAWSGSQFIAVGESGSILSSPDGINWTSRVSGTSQSLQDIIWNGSQLVAVGGDFGWMTGFSGVILTSPDGIDWVPSDSHISVPLVRVQWGGGQFVAVGIGRSVFFLKSSF